MKLRVVHIVCYSASVCTCFSWIPSRCNDPGASHLSGSCDIKLNSIWLPIHGNVSVQEPADGHRFPTVNIVATVV